MSSTAQKKRLAHLALAGVALAAALILIIPPETSGIYPRCPIYSSLHILCPGCGATRALAALLRGNLREALHWNALVTIAFPFLVIFAGKCYWRAVSAAQFTWPSIPEPLLSLCVGFSLSTTAVFTIVRNLHFA